MLLQLISINFCVELDKTMLRLAYNEGAMKEYAVFEWY